MIYLNLNSIFNLFLRHTDIITVLRFNKNQINYEIYYPWYDFVKNSIQT